MGLLLLVGTFYYFQYKSRNEKEVYTLKNQALRLQINPHFFFNAMNSINRYIGNNEPIMAKSYLTKFAKVMRLSLDSVQDDVVPLQQEIDFLTNYIEIEKLQHKNFEYQINVEHTIDTEEVVVPPLIVQPYIENAILHGFVNKSVDEKGEIQIAFSADGEFLLVEISDNGVGIESAKQVDFKETGHKSLAMKITQKRINAFSKKNIEVNFSSPKNGTGTIVKFKMPIVKLTG
jgi:sensor histidine kinase YesM